MSTRNIRTLCSCQVWNFFRYVYLFQHLNLFSQNYGHHTSSSDIKVIAALHEHVQAQSHALYVAIEKLKQRFTFRRSKPTHSLLHTGSADNLPFNICSRTYMHNASPYSMEQVSGTSIGSCSIVKTRWLHNSGALNNCCRV